MFGPAQHGVAKAVADCVAEGVIPPTRPTTCSSPSACSSIGKPRTTRRSRSTTIGDQGSDARAVKGEPKASEVTAKKDAAHHPFAAG